MSSAGIVTALPLLAFGVAVVRLPFTTLGMLQYIGPTIQFFIGIWLTQEAMPAQRFAGFLLTWVALVLLTFDALAYSTKRQLSKLPR
jgi:chloramphenicol-sensitive protein RarD